MKHLKKLIILLMSLFLISNLCACKGTGSDEEESNDNNTTIEENLDEALYDSLVNAIANVKELDPAIIPEYILYIEENVTLSVIDSLEIEDTITANVLIESPDLYTAVSNISTDIEYSSEYDLNQDIIAAMEETPFRTYEETLYFRYVDGEYKPVFTDTFLNAYYGGGMDLRQEWIQSLVEGN